MSEECYYCHGSGKDDLDELGRCKPCGGRGWVDVDSGEEEEA